jgi:hypothetical protein
MIPLILIIASFPSTAIAQAGTFTATGNMTVAREFASATLLANGQVLIAGSGAADIYEPRTGTFTAIGAHGSNVATRLADGRVLFVVSDSDSPNRAEIFDPASGTFTTSGTTITGQIGGYATLLPNGQVLVAGGFISFNSSPLIYAKPELYDPATGTFSATGSFAPTGGTSFYVSGGPDISAVVRLADGRVLFAGEPLSELYDPLSGTFSLTGSMVTRCGLFGSQAPLDYIDGRTATLLTDGKVLLTGGEQEDCGRFPDAEIYDSATGIFTATGKMSRGRDNHSATLLYDGTVLIAGGETWDCTPTFCSFTGTTTSTEIYNPSTGSFTLGDTMLVNRAGHTATVLKNGAVLLAGGYGFEGIGKYLGDFASAELYNQFGDPVVFGTASSLHDFNGDGKADILRRDGAGSVSLWLTNGRAIESQTFVANIWPGWSIVGSGDFNGDGKADILWRDPGGTVAIWLMDGAAVASYSTVANVPTDWSISGVGDFNGDGKADILWRHSSGGVRVWLMDGYSIAVDNEVANIWTGWSIVGTGDFNGDRKADVLWRSSAGEVAIWLMDGSSVGSWGIPGIVPATAAVAGVADFNGDGKADILWRDSLGNVSLWSMDGLNVIQSSLIANIWTGWAITGVGDFDGDAKADILWRDTFGHEVVWLMNGSTVLSYGEVY